MNIDWTPIDAVEPLQTAIDAYWRKGHVLARDADLLRWQYRWPGNPNRLSILKASDAGRILGMLGLIRGDFCDRGRRLPALWLATWFAAPDAPGGTGLALLREAMATGVSVVACLGFNDTAERIYRALRFTVLDAVPRWVRAVCPQALGRLLACDETAYADSRAVLTDRASQASVAVSNSVRVVSYERGREADWDRAWEAQFAPVLVGTWRDAAYLRWRYVDHPRFEYRRLIAEEQSNQSIRGLAVHRLERVQGSSERVVRIVELVGDNEACRSLLAAVLREAEAAGAAMADFFCTLPEAADALGASGFVRDDRLPTPVPMLFQPLDVRRNRVRAAFWRADDANTTRTSASRGLFDEANLYVTRSDGDQDRPN